MCDVGAADGDTMMSAARAGGDDGMIESKDGVINVKRMASVPSCKLVEVKGPRDRLSLQQIAWLELLSTFVHVEVIYIKEPVLPKASKA